MANSGAYISILLLSFSIIGRTLSRPVIPMPLQVREIILYNRHLARKPMHLILGAELVEVD